jgi:hypothetical protein
MTSFDIMLLTDMPRTCGYSAMSKKTVYTICHGMHLSREHISGAIFDTNLQLTQVFTAFLILNSEEFN